MHHIQLRLPVLSERARSALQCMSTGRRVGHLFPVRPRHFALIAQLLRACVSSSYPSARPSTTYPIVTKLSRARVRPLASAIRCCPTRARRSTFSSFCSLRRQARHIFPSTPRPAWSDNRLIQSWQGCKLSPTRPNITAESDSARGFCRCGSTGNCPRFVKVGAWGVRLPGV